LPLPVHHPFIGARERPIKPRQWFVHRREPALWMAWV
jgi:hypothetical protein